MNLHAVQQNEPVAETLLKLMPGVMGNSPPEVNALKEVTAKSAGSIAHAWFYDEKNEDKLYLYKKCLVSKDWSWIEALQRKIYLISLFDMPFCEKVL